MFRFHMRTRLLFVLTLLASLAGCNSPDPKSTAKPNEPRRQSDGKGDDHTHAQLTRQPVHMITNSLGMTLALIPVGEFLMGSPRGGPDRAVNEFPQHHVRITRPFYLGTIEVTQGQWETVMHTTPWRGQEFVVDGADLPAVWISWVDAVEFCRRLSAIDHMSYRLPTEAEWEYACRAGTKTRYIFGDDESRLEDYAWYGKNAGSKHPFAFRGGLKPANAFGLFDMHGNVLEWCSDWYDGNYYSQTPEDDPPGPANGSGRVCRGGSYILVAELCRSASRASGWPEHHDYFVGFRVARNGDSEQ